MNDTPLQPEMPPDREPFLQVPLLGNKSPLANVRPIAASLTLAAMRDLAAGIHKSDPKRPITEIWDFRAREKVSAVTGLHANTISKHWQVLQAGGLIEARARGKYATTPRRLTAAGWKAFDEAEKINVPLSLFSNDRSFYETLVLGYIIYRSGLTANDPATWRGYCIEGTRSIAVATGLSRQGVQKIIDSLLEPVTKLVFAS